MCRKDDRHFISLGSAEHAAWLWEMETLADGVYQLCSVESAGMLSTQRVCPITLTGVLGKGGGSEVTCIPVRACRDLKCLHAWCGVEFAW